MISSYFYRNAASPTHISKLIPELEQGKTKLVELSKKIGMTYANLRRCMNDMQKEGLIKKTKDKNTLEFSLTKKGQALCTSCKLVKMVVESWDKDTINNMFKMIEKDLKRTKKLENKNEL